MSGTSTSLANALNDTLDPLLGQILPSYFTPDFLLKSKPLSSFYDPKDRTSSLDGFAVQAISTLPKDDYQMQRRAHDVSVDDEAQMMLWAQHPDTKAMALPRIVSAVTRREPSAQSNTDASCLAGNSLWQDVTSEPLNAHTDDTGTSDPATSSLNVRYYNPLDLTQTNGIDTHFTVAQSDSMRVFAMLSPVDNIPPIFAIWNGPRLDVTSDPRSIPLTLFTPSSFADLHVHDNVEGEESKIRAEQ